MNGRNEQEPLLPRASSCDNARSWKIAKFSFQLFATLIAQGTNRLYYIRCLPVSLRQIGFLSESEVNNQLWWYATGLSVSARLVVVLFSRAPAIWKSLQPDARRDQSATEYVVATFLPENLIARRNKEVHDIKASKDAKEITGALAPDYAKKDGVDQAPDVLSKHHRLISVTRKTSILDSFFSGPSDEFFIVSCYRLFFNDGNYAPWWVFSLGGVMGLNDAKSYYDFRIPSVECSMVVLAEIWKNRRDLNRMNIDTKEFKKNLHWSIYVGLTRGVITYFSATDMMAVAAQWTSKSTGLSESIANPLGESIAIIMALTCAFTNFHNRFSLGLKDCVKKELAHIPPVPARDPVAEQGHEYALYTHLLTSQGSAAEPSPSASFSTCAKGVIGAVAVLCIISTGWDYLLTVMSYLSAGQKIKNPPNGSLGFWFQFGFSVVGSLPICVYNYNFTAQSAIDAVCGLFANKNGESAADSEGAAPRRALGVTPGGFPEMSPSRYPGRAQLSSALDAVRNAVPSYSR